MSPLENVVPTHVTPHVRAAGMLSERMRLSTMIIDRNSLALDTNISPRIRMIWYNRKRR